MKVKCGSTNQLLSLASIDPRGTLKQSQGKITYSTSCRVPVNKGRIPITVTVDSTSQIREVVENNNTGKIVASASRFSQASPPVPQTHGHSDIQRKLIAAKKPTGRKTSLSIPLVIDRVYLHNNRIHVRLRNDSGKTLDNSFLLSTRLRVTGGGRQKTWPLSTVDGNHRVMHKKGHLDFDTTHGFDPKDPCHCPAGTKGGGKKDSRLSYTLSTCGYRSYKHKEKNRTS